VFTNYSNPAAVAFYKSTGARIENGDDLLFVYDELTAQQAAPADAEPAECLGGCWVQRR